MLGIDAMNKYRNGIENVMLLFRNLYLYKNGLYIAFKKFIFTYYKLAMKSKLSLWVLLPFSIISVCTILFVLNTRHYLGYSTAYFDFFKSGTVLTLGLSTFIVGGLLIYTFYEEIYKKMVSVTLYSGTISLKRAGVGARLYDKDSISSINSGIYFSRYNIRNAYLKIKTTDGRSYILSEMYIVNFDACVQALKAYYPEKFNPC